MSADLHGKWWQRTAVAGHGSRYERECEAHDNRDVLARVTVGAVTWTRYRSGTAIGVDGNGGVFAKIAIPVAALDERCALEEAPMRSKDLPDFIVEAEGPFEAVTERFEVDEDEPRHCVTVSSSPDLELEVPDPDRITWGDYGPPMSNSLADTGRDITMADIAEACRSIQAQAKAAREGLMALAPAAIAFTRRWHDHYMSGHTLQVDTVPVPDLMLGCLYVRCSVCDASWSVSAIDAASEVGK